MTAGAGGELEELAVVGPLLVLDAIGLGLAALVARRRVVESALDAGVELGTAAVAAVAAANRAVEGDGPAASLAVAIHVAILTRSPAAVVPVGGPDLAACPVRGLDCGHFKPEVPSRMLARSAASLLLAAALLSPRHARADVTMNEEQFKTYHDYLDALKDPRVEKMKPAKRLPAIARNFGIPLSRLKAAIRAGEEAGGVEAIAQACVEAIKQSVAGTPLDGRLRDVRVDTSDSHVVTYVSWKAGRPDAIEQEACLLAVRARKAAPISADLRLWAVDAGNPDHKVFDGMISGEAAENIRETRIPDFADSRYIKLFEHVHLDRPGQ